MNLAVVIACVVAMLTAALLIPFRNYAHALIWSRRFALVGLGGYLLANAAAGVVGWLVARKLGWRPEDVWLRGILWGEFGQAIARVRFDRIPKPEGAGEAVSAIGAVGSWMLTVVDWGVGRAAERRLGALPDPQLAQYVSDLYRKGPADDQQLHEGAKKYIGVEVSEAISALTDPAKTEADRVDARSFLRSSGAKWINDYKFLPPAASP
jgi:hypothetical protein